MTDTHTRKPIQTLPPGVANRIAAGEVVERPAAVVKELIENALDAGATTVTLAVQDSGRTLIKVVDDGGGMSRNDLLLAVQRHATSKLSRFEDLDELDTFGFRGEALPSIAAVSRLEIVSRTAESDVGARLKIAGGEFEVCEPASAPVGTSISVSHLFYNVPARRKFLRGDATEFKWIATTFRCFALAFPEVVFQFYRGSELLYDLPAGEARGRLAGLFGDDVAEDLIAFEQEGSQIRARGFISPPSLLQRNKDSQFLFVNRRPITHPGLTHTIYTACEPFFVSGGHPLFVAFIEMPPDRFDINVHPAKREVKFADENVARSTLWLAIRNAVAGERRPSLVAGIDTTPAEGTIVPTPVSPPREPAAKLVPAGIDAPEHLQPWLTIDRHHKAPALPFPANRQSSEPLPPPDRKPDRTVLEPTFADLRELGLPKSTDEPQMEGLPEKIWQTHDSYIVAPVHSGLVFIDQHAAHERILYEKALTAMEKAPWPSQSELFDAFVEVKPEDEDAVEFALPLLRAMGFGLKARGEHRYQVLSTPTGVMISDVVEMVEGILAEYLEGATAESDPRKRLAAGFSCRAAIKANHKLEPVERQRLIEDLFQTEAPEFCPHGRPVYHILRLEEIEKWFKRV